MKRNIRHIILGLAIAIIYSGCSISEHDDSHKSGSLVPIKISASREGVQLSRAGNMPDNIENALILVFDNTNNLTTRKYCNYSLGETVYLKSGASYKIFAIANLDDSNCPNGNAEEFLAGVTNTSDLSNYYILGASQSIPDLGKMVMCTETIQTVSVVASTAEVTVELTRMHSLVEVTIYNLVDQNGTNLSGVYPQTYAMDNSPRGSFLFKRSAVDYQNAVPSPGFAQFSQTPLPAAESTPVYLNNKYYARRTFSFYSFENLSGTVNDLTDPYDRRTKAPPHAFFITMLSNTSSGNLLNTYIYPGHGRETVSGSDIINNFDIDRNCIYHVTIYIEGVNNITDDSRREYLERPILFTLPEEARRIDAHYVDMPAFLQGSGGGVLLQTGTCDSDENGNVIYEDGGIIWEPGKKPRNLVLMKDSDADHIKWLRLSTEEPYNPNTATTKLFVNVLDGEDIHTVLLHFNEFIDQAAHLPLSTDDPPKRTAVIRGGYVHGAANLTDYEAGVAIGIEQVFYRTVSQYGLKTVGQVGGYNGSYYATILGVESFEEYQFRYYDSDTPQPDGVIWNYTGASISHNDRFDGKKSTIQRYNAHWNGQTPSQKGDSGYDPVFNTNAADYCMRKNRDENGDGWITGDEVKWYLPTPAQQYMIAFWQDEFRFPANQGSSTLEGAYWSVYQADASNALEINYSTVASQVNIFPVANYGFNNRRKVRCVRDINLPKGYLPPVYKSGRFVAVNLTNYLPANKVEPKNHHAGIIDYGPYPMTNNAKLARTFYFGKAEPYQFLNPNPNTYGSLQQPCVNFKEHGETDWIMPSQREMLFIFAHAGLIDHVGNSVNSYANLRTSYYWTNTSGNFKIDFTSGANGGNNTSDRAYFRCVQYLNTSTPARE